MRGERGKKRETERYTERTRERKGETQKEGKEKKKRDSLCLCVCVRVCEKERVWIQDKYERERHTHTHTSSSNDNAAAHTVSLGGGGSANVRAVSEVGGCNSKPSAVSISVCCGWSWCVTLRSGPWYSIIQRPASTPSFSTPLPPPSSKSSTLSADRNCSL